MKTLSYIDYRKNLNPSFKQDIEFVLLNQSVFIHTSTVFLPNDRSDIFVIVSMETQGEFESHILTKWFNMHPGRRGLQHTHCMRYRNCDQTVKEVEKDALRTIKSLSQLYTLSH